MGGGTWKGWCWTYHTHTQISLCWRWDRAVTHLFPLRVRRHQPDLIRRRETRRGARLAGKSHPLSGGEGGVRRGQGGSMSWLLRRRSVMCWIVASRLRGFYGAAIVLIWSTFTELLCNVAGDTPYISMECSGTARRVNVWLSKKKKKKKKNEWAVQSAAESAVKRAFNLMYFFLLIPFISILIIDFISSLMLQKASSALCNLFA